MEPTAAPGPTKTPPVGPPEAATATKMAVNREVEETPVAPTPARTTNYNVRELLELERKIYDESIEKQGRLYEALQQGTLHEYLVQCLPLESERDRALEVAKTRFQLSRRNASDLLAFELKQAGDIYEAHCLDLKQRLRAAAERKRARVVQRLEQIKHGLPLTVHDDADPLKMASENDGSESPSDASILTSNGSLDTVALEKQLAAAHAANLAAFNLDHLEHNLPPARAIVADVVDEVERHRAFLKEVTDPDTVCGVVVDPNVGKVWIGHMDVFTVLDHVVVWSRLSDEEFYGQIVKVHEDRIALALLCGSLVSVSVEQLRKQLCTLRQQEISASARLGMIDERMARMPKRKRHRRKHTIGMRQKI